MVDETVANDSGDEKKPGDVPALVADPLGCDGRIGVMVVRDTSGYDADGRTGGETRHHK